jgi:peptidoglycan/xylan/chitin deacetylase (PgdA/CDA1 family)
MPMRTVSLLFHDVYATDPRESGFGSPAADRYKLPLGQFEALLAELAQVRADAPVLVQDISGGLKASAYHDDIVTGDLKVSGYPYLVTVDDGGVSYYTVVADRLEARGWRGHCFVSTDAIGTRGFLSASQLRELDRRGHVIGSHSASHPARFSACEAAHMRQEWTRSRMVLEDLLGHEVHTASVPGGYYSRRVARSARDAGLRVVFTSEPITASHDEDGILVIGRFTLRRGHPTNRAGHLAGREPWVRYQEWASWRAKGVVKPLLGPLYSPAADWVLTHFTPGNFTPGSRRPSAVTPGSRRPSGLRSQPCR